MSVIIIIKKKIVKELDTSYDYLLMDDFEMDKQLEIKYKDMFKRSTKIRYKNTRRIFYVAERLIIKSFRSIESNTINKGNLAISFDKIKNSSCYLITLNEY